MIEKRYYLIKKNYVYNSNYEFVMMIAGGFVGAVTAKCIDDIKLMLTEIMNLIKQDMFFEQNPMEILYAKTDLEWWAIIVGTFLFVVITMIQNRNAEKRNRENIFIMDMCEYELKKIDETLNKL